MRDPEEEKEGEGEGGSYKSLFPIEFDQLNMVLRVSARVVTAQSEVEAEQKSRGSWPLLVELSPFPPPLNLNHYQT